MARPLRLEFPGAFWHVTSRGNEKKEIFRSDRDRSIFLEILGSVVRRSHWRLHAYTLMGSHYHLEIETPEATLSKGMRQLNGVYAQKFNALHERCGHLFQGRFDARLIQDIPYALAVARYVVLNPVRAALVGSPGSWPWSSYRAMAGLSKVPPWLDVDWTLDLFGTDRKTARRAYRRFVCEGIGSDDDIDTILSRESVVGNREFRLETQVRIDSATRSPEHPRRDLEVARPTIAQLTTGVGQVFGVTEFDLRSRASSDARAALTLLLRQDGGASLREIGEILGVGPSGAHYLLSKGLQKETEAESFRRRVAVVRQLAARTEN